MQGRGIGGETYERQRKVTERNRQRGEKEEKKQRGRDRDVSQRERDRGEETEAERESGDI
jgi:hypothetical protein